MLILLLLVGQDIIHRLAFMANEVAFLNHSIPLPLPFPTIKSHKKFWLNQYPGFIFYMLYKLYKYKFTAELYLLCINNKYKYIL